MADYPDLYIDGWTISAGVGGLTITLTRSDPPVPAGEVGDVPGLPVVRLRMSLHTANELGDSLREMAAEATTSPVQQDKLH